MKKFLSTLLIISLLIVSQLGFVTIYNETNILENTITKEKQVNQKLLIKKSISLVIFDCFTYPKNKILKISNNNYVGYFAPQNTYYLLTGIIKNIN